MTQIHPKPRFSSLEERIAFVQKVGQQAVSEAIERHRRLGESIVVWQDGQVVWIPADQIPPQQLELVTPILRDATKA